MNEQSYSARSAAAGSRVLSAALRAFAANGYSRSSLAQIAAEAGLTAAGLLHHDRSKEELLIAVLAERDRLDAERFQMGASVGWEPLERQLWMVKATPQALD
jgi:AcrR family transcriptional regulator